jgi:hypothetical protein
MKPIVEEKSEPTKYDKFIEQTENKPKNEFKIGQTVLHPKFGVGKILKFEDKFVDIDFDKLGIKTLLLDIAPLKILK